MLEKTILSNLLHNEDFARQALPLLKDEYFQQTHEKVAFGLINEFVDTFNQIPNEEILLVDLSNLSMPAKDYETTENYIKMLASEERKPTEWLISKASTFIQDRAVYNAITESITILDGSSKKDKGMIPQILSDALAISFDTAIGHDYIDDFLDRYKFYHQKEDKISFDIDILNKITAGGLSKKTLNIFMAGTGGGKSMFMCHAAAYNLMCGKNVLYITNEMSQEKIAERIDANLLDTPISDITKLPWEVYERKINNLKKQALGKLIIKEYPTASAHAGHFRHLLNELKVKKNFKPDIIYIDYLNICASSRMKKGQTNSYEYIKSIAEELRGLAVEYDVPIVSATQVTRSGFNSSDMDLKDTSESFGLPATADLMIGMIVTEEMIEMNQILFKQLKNRYNDLSYYTKFVVGVHRAKMRFFNIDQDNDNDPDKPVFDNTSIGESDNGSKFGKFNFG